MKIFRGQIETDIVLAISHTIENSTDGGAIEKAHYKVNKAAEIIGKLVQVLHENGHLTNTQVNDMLSYHFRVED